MNPFEQQYKEFIRQAEETRAAHQQLIDQINSSKIQAAQSSKMWLQPLLQDVARMQSLTPSLPDIRTLLDSPALQLVREANISIAKHTADMEMQAIKEAANITELWKSQLTNAHVADAVNSMNTFRYSAQCVKVSEISILAERTLASIPLEHIGKLLNTSKEIQSDVRQKVLGFSNSYTQLFKTVEQTDFRAFCNPAVLTYLPSIEFYANTKVIEAISIKESIVFDEEAGLIDEITHEAEDRITICLKKLNPALIRLWEGAKEALSSRNPDGPRHFITSLRELVTHVIHELAPDEDVRTWTTKEEYYDDKNRPTRRARLFYICRDIGSDSFSQFLNSDIEAFLACINLFQQGTHQIETPFTPSQLQAILLRTEFSIIFLIETAIVPINFGNA